MALIPQDFIRQLIERSDIVEVIGAHVKLNKKGNRWSGLCPFHNEKTPSFSVNAEKGFYHCFGCGVHGDALNFIVEQNGGDFIAGVETLASIYGMVVPRQESDNDYIDARQWLEKAMEHWQKQLRKSDAAKQYLKQRGMTGETAKNFLIGYAPNRGNDLVNVLKSAPPQLLVDVGLAHKSQQNDGINDFFRNRIMVPILDGRRRVIGFGGRTMGGDKRKYINSPENHYFPKKNTLFGLPQASEAARKKNRLLICEGYMDVIMLSQHGFAESVATMGTAVTLEQMRKAVRVASNIIFAFDGDTAGKKGGYKGLKNILPMMKDGMSVSFLYLPEGEDPDSFIQKNGVSAFEEKIKQAKSFGDFMIEMIESEHQDEMSDEAKKSDMMKEFSSLVGNISVRDGANIRQVLQKKLSDYTKIKDIKLPVSQSNQPQKPYKNYKMQPGILFDLLCFFEWQPEFLERHHNIPLHGNPNDEYILAMILNNEQLRWQMGDEILKPSDVLEAEGYGRLAIDLRDWGKNHLLQDRTKPEEEFKSLLERSKKSNFNAKKNWKKIISTSPNDIVTELPD